jgi:hypothetical protein
MQNQWHPKWGKFAHVSRAFWWLTWSQLFKFFKHEKGRNVSENFHWMLYHLAKAAETWPLWIFVSILPNLHTLSNSQHNQPLQWKLFVGISFLAGREIIFGTICLLRLDLLVDPNMSGAVSCMNKWKLICNLFEGTRWAIMDEFWYEHIFLLCCFRNVGISTLNMCLATNFAPNPELPPLGNFSFNLCMLKEGQ